MFFRVVFKGVALSLQIRSYPKQGKKEQSIGIKPFYSNTYYGFEFKKTA